MVSSASAAPPKESPLRLKPKIITCRPKSLAGSTPQRIAPAIETSMDQSMASCTESSTPQRIAPAIETTDPAHRTAIRRAAPPKESPLRLKQPLLGSRSSAQHRSTPQRIAPAIETAMPGSGCRSATSSTPQRIAPAIETGGANEEKIMVLNAAPPKESPLRLKPIPGIPLFKIWRQHPPKNRPCD